MKKLFAILAAAAAIVACSKADIVTPEDPQEESQGLSFDDINFDIEVADLDFNVEPGTKAMKKGWANGDMLQLWFNGDYQQTPDVTLQYSSSTGKWTVYSRRIGVTSAFSNGKSVIAICDAQNNNFVGAYNYTTGSYSSSSANYPAGIWKRTINLGGFLCDMTRMLAVCRTTYTLSSTTLTVKLNSWTYYTPIQVVIKGLPSNKSEYYTLYCDKLTTCGGLTLISNGTVEPLSPAGSLQAVGIPNADGVAFYFYSVRNNGTNQTFEFTLRRYPYLNSSAKPLYTSKYTVTKTLTVNSSRCYGINLDQSRFSHGTSSVSSKDSSIPAGRTDCEWVQLWAGGPKFAKFNINATTNSYAGISDWHNPYVGGLYAWNNPNLNSRSSGVDWKTNVSVGLTDVATKLWGDCWREPTEEEMQALLNNCTYTWLTGSSGSQYESGCKLAGFKVTGKGAYSSNTIFLPAGGYYDAKDQKIFNKGQAMYLWTSSTFSSMPYRFGCQNGTKDPTLSMINVTSSYQGHAVRAVVNE